jgi:hypothetical protein
LGFKSGGAHFAAIVLAGISTLAILVGLLLVDKVGCKALLIEGNVQMFLSLVSNIQKMKPSNFVPFVKYTLVSYKLILITK